MKHVLVLLCCQILFLTVGKTQMKLEVKDCHTLYAFFSENTKPNKDLDLFHLVLEKEIYTGIWQKIETISEIAIEHYFYQLPPAKYRVILARLQRAKKVRTTYSISDNEAKGYPTILNRYSNTVNLGSSSNCNDYNEIIKLETNEKKPFILIAPNPSTNRIFIEWPVHLTISNILIYNLNGQIIHSTSPLNHRLEFDFQDFTAGLYFVHFYHKGTIIHSERISILP